MNASSHTFTKPVRNTRSFMVYPLPHYATDLAYGTHCVRLWGQGKCSIAVGSNGPVGTEEYCTLRGMHWVATGEAQGREWPRSDEQLKADIAAARVRLAELA